MKSFVIPLFVVWLAFLGTTRGQGAAANAEAGGPVVCHQELMQSYLLKGTEVSNNRTMLLCPTIKKNCCTRHDIQRVFHYAKDVLPARLAEYKQKMDIMFAQLREIHKELVKDRPLFRGNRRRRSFCARQFRAVLGFDFQTLYSKIQEEWFRMDHFVEEHSRRYFCMLCDGAAHENMIIRTERRAATFHLDYCQDVIKSNKDLLKILNIEMINYMRLVQNVVDCQHYSRSFALRFPRPDKLRLRNEVINCMEGLEGARFHVACAPVCREIKFAQIVPLFNGDFDFLHEMVLVFNRFLKYRESGNLISMKLRGFFKRFRIPRRMTRSRRRNFLRNLTPRLPKDPRKSKSSPGRKLTDASAAHHAERKLSERTPPVPSAHARQPFVLSPKQAKSVASPKQLPFKRSLSEVSWGLAAHSRPGRLLQNSIFSSSVREVSVKAKITPFPRLPAPSFDKTLSEFYHDIEIPKSENPRPTVYRIRGNPLVFDRFEQNWVDDKGINYNTYTNLRFGMSRKTLYRLLYTYRKPELPDSRLTIFLMDFPTEFFKRAASIFNDDFTIMPNNYSSQYSSEIDYDDRRRRKLGQSASRPARKKRQSV